MNWILHVSNDEVTGLLPTVLERPAAEGARIIALHWLHQLHRMRHRWGQLAVAASPSDQQVSDASPLFLPDAEELTTTLHKARVALRRLRAVEKEHPYELEDVFSRSMSRALRKLGKATNTIRDRDVQIEWLDAEMDALDDTAREEAAQLRASLADTAKPAVSRVEAAFAKHFDPIICTLSGRLSWYFHRMRVGNGVLPQVFYADAIATRIEDGVQRVQHDLDAIVDLIGTDAAHADSDADVQEQLHDIRLHLKRHRALLAPLTERHPALAALYDLETRGQDLLGAMRDADLLAQRARKDGFDALAAVLDDTRLSNFEAFLDQWTANRERVQEAFENAINALRGAAYDARAGTFLERSEPEHHDIRVSAFLNRSERQPVDAQQERHGAGHTHNGAALDVSMEIERKFLLKDLPPEAIAMPPIVIEQGWIPGTMLRERLRRSTYPDGRVRCTRTVKLGRPQARIEIEEDTGQAIFQAMWALTTSARIRKRRHVVRDGAHNWEIDVFSDRDLVLAEVELSAEDEQVAIPAWLAPYIVRDVTGESAYLNSQMARPELAPDDHSAPDQH